MNKLIAIFILLSSLASAQEIRRATLDSNATVASTVCAGTNISTSSGAPFTNWYDSSGNSTSGDLLTTNTPPTGNYKGHKVTTWAAASAPYTALNLVVRSSAVADGSATSGAAQNSVVQYSLNSGSTWTTIRAGSSWAVTDDTVALSPSQSLSTLHVRGCASDKGGNGQTLTIYDIRTEGTLAGGGGGGGGGTHYAPTTTLSEIRDNNTSGCAAANAPSVGTTSCVDNFPNPSTARQTQFPITAVTRTGGTTVKAQIVDNYNFSTSQPDQVIINGVADAVNFPNGTFTVTALGACTSPGDVSCYVQYTQSGANVVSSGGTATRYAQTSPFVPPPKNVANYTSDGIDLHYMPFLGGTGGLSTATIFVRLLPWFRCASSTNGNCIFTPADGTSASDLDHGINQSGSHTTVGYVSNSTTQITAQINAMKRLNIDALMGDDAGLAYTAAGGHAVSSTRLASIQVYDKIRDILAGQSAFQWAVSINETSWDTSASCGTSGQTPVCVEKVIRDSLDYWHFSTGQTFTSALDGKVYNGGGYFTNAAYYTIGGKPVVGSFFADSNYFGSCSGCAVYNNNVGGVVCTGSTDCWTKILAGVAAHQASWTVKPIYYWRNNFSHSGIGTSAAYTSNHVFVIMLENRSISNAMLYMPYLAGLVNNNNSSSAYGVAQGLQVYSNSHGSFAAYLQLTSGTVNNGSGTGYALTTVNFSGGGSVSNDCNGDGCSANAPNTGAGVVDVPNLVRQFAANGKTWRAYLESKPTGTNGYFTYTSGNWVRRHNPFAFYSPEVTTEPSLGVFTAQAAAANQVDTANMLNDINNNTLKNYSWLSPNLVHDAHNQGPAIPSCNGNADCNALGNADLYLQTFMPQLLASPQFQPGGDGVLLITFDESELSGDNQCGNTPETNNCGGHILSVLIGPNVKKGYSSSTHYKQDSQLRLVCDLMNLSACPGNGASAPTMSEFFIASDADQGYFRWINPTGNRSNTDFPGYDSAITSSLSSPRHFQGAAWARDDHAQSTFQDDNLGMEGYCGKTWLSSFSRPNVGGAYSTAHDLEGIQLITWNDIEQGTMIENGIDSCYTISASISDGRTLSYNIATSDAVNAPLSPLNSTLHHIAIYVSLDGINVMQLGSNITPAASGTIDMTSFQLDAGTYQVYVKLVPWTNMQTSITGAMAFTSGVVLPSGNNTNGSQAHRGTLTTRLEVK